MTDSEKQAWQEYIDNKISHSIGAVEYGNFFYDQIKEIADSAKDDCDAILVEYKRCGTKTKCNLIKSKIDERLEELEEEIASFINSELPKIIENENEWLDNDVAPFLGIKFDKVRSALSLLAAIPIAQIVSASTFANNTTNKLRNIYNSILGQSLVTGSPFEDSKEDFTPRFNTFDNQLETEAETLGFGLSDQYDRIIFTKNDKKIKRYIWTAILDTHTCIGCGELDGQIFDSIESVPMYAKHANCRCTILPLNEDFEEEEVRETYSEWFERQPKKEKRAILGKTRFQLYEQGMKIKQFVNNGKITPLKDLKPNQTE